MEKGYKTLLVTIAFKLYLKYICDSNDNFNLKLNYGQYAQNN